MVQELVSLTFPHLQEMEEMVVLVAERMQEVEQQAAVT
jgi:hypothetical protein